MPAVFRERFIAPQDNGLDFGIRCLGYPHAAIIHNASMSVLKESTVNNKYKEGYLCIAGGQVRLKAVDSAAPYTMDRSIEAYANVIAYQDFFILTPLHNKANQARLNPANQGNDPGNL
ncbi:hypothetical protein CBS101457_005539 [Exobasidium rhododendri]|nr:hypothetical protein CBS101457_005539 [Exobasidium rhododendri]